jgi:predicted RNase H-like HicB family nuclease
MMEQRYHINVFWSDRKRCWIADVPDLTSCSGLGEGPLEALGKVQVAQKLWLDSARAANLPIPEPSYDWKTEPLV